MPVASGTGYKAARRAIEEGAGRFVGPAGIPQWAKPIWNIIGHSFEPSVFPGNPGGTGMLVGGARPYIRAAAPSAYKWLEEHPEIWRAEFGTMPAARGSAAITTTRPDIMAQFGPPPVSGGGQMGPAMMIFDPAEIMRPWNFSSFYHLVAPYHETRHVKAIDRYFPQEPPGGTGFANPSKKHYEKMKGYVSPFNNPLVTPPAYGGSLQGRAHRVLDELARRDAMRDLALGSAGRGINVRGEGPLFIDPARAIWELSQGAKSLKGEPPLQGF